MYCDWAEERLPESMPFRHFIDKDTSVRFITEVIATGRLTYAPQTMNIVVSALVHFWKSQKRNNVNTTTDSPRELLSVYIAAAKRASEQRRLEGGIHKGKAAVVKSYNTVEELVDICSFFWRRPNGFVGLRDRCFVLMCHFGLLRGSAVREMDWSDLYSETLAPFGPTPSIAISMVLGKGKTNQNGSIQTVSSLRADNVETCMHGALGMLLFYRFHILCEEVPDFFNNMSWFNRKLMTRGPRHSLEEAVNYEPLAKSVKDALNAANISSSASTHAPRGGGAQMAELAGISSLDIARQGHWESSVLSSVYLKNIPMPVLLALSGFPNDRGCYFIRRDAVCPPPGLLSQVFPWVDGWIQR